MLRKEIKSRKKERVRSGKANAKAKIMPSHLPLMILKLGVEVFFDFVF